MKKLKKAIDRESRKRIIDRFILHPNFEIYSRCLAPPSLEDPIYVTKNEIIENIGKAKHFLIKERNFKKGDHVIMTTLFWPEFIIWFFAVSELGGSFLVIDSPGESTINIFKHRLDIYKKIDHVISGAVKFPLKELGMEHIAFHEDSYKNYEFSQESLDNVTAEESDILMYALSSGTTDTPKVIGHSHRFFYDLMSRNALIFELKSDDRCLHSKNLHHGSVVGVYLLPTLKYCRYHFFQSFGGEKNDWVEPYIDLIKKYKINRCLMYWEYLIKQFSSQIKFKELDHSLDIGVLTKVDSQAIRHLCLHGRHSIISIFGCTETSGPLFLQKINRKNYENFDPTNFGRPLDDFYKINIVENVLHVTMPDGSIISTGDRFEIVNNEFYYKGRNAGLKINGTPIYVPLVINAVEKFFKFSDAPNNDFSDLFDITIDNKNSKIYMRSSRPVELDELNRFLLKEFRTEDYSISLIIVGPKEKFINGIKLDSERIRCEARKILKID
jgi:hypothetical protein